MDRMQAPNRDPEEKSFLPLKGKKHLKVRKMMKNRALGATVAENKSWPLDHAKADPMAAINIAILLSTGSGGQSALYI